MLRLKISLSLVFFYFASLIHGTIWQNDQVRITDYPDTAIASVAGQAGWTTYSPNATEISYKGRWDSKHISWWSAPGLRLGFSGTGLAISFGNYTSDGTLVGYRLDGQDWMFTNVTASSTHLFITSNTTGYNLTSTTGANQTSSHTFELRVTNWAYGVQIAGVHVSSGKLYRLADAPRTIEVIGDSLSAGQYTTYEGLASWAWGFAEGFGNSEFSITAYPGICLVDQDCWGNLRGQAYQWFQTSDTSYRATQIYGDNPEPWDFAAHPAADIVVINIGTNDNNTANNVTNADYLSTYIEFVGKVHDIWPNAQIILHSLWIGFGAVGNTYAQGAGFVDEILQVYDHYEPQGFIHYFNTTGIMQHNDIGPQYHPTDIGAIKIASHLIQYVKLTLGWDMLSTGPEVQADTLYWNDEQNY